MRHANRNIVVRMAIVAAIIAAVAASVTGAAGPSPRRQSEGDFATYAEMSIELVDGGSGAPAPAPSALNRPRPLSSFFARITDLLSRHKRPDASLERYSPAVVTLTMPARKIRIVDHGSAASGHLKRDVTALIGCWFTIEDRNGYEWTFTYDARVFSPNGTQLKFQTRYQYDVSTYSDSINTEVTDPDEGTYSCTIRWAIGYSWIDQLTNHPQATVTYLVPTGETSYGMGWAMFPQTQYQFNAQLQPTSTSFTGRKIKEEDPGGGVDGCHKQGDNVLEYKAVTPASMPWIVQGSNVYGYDQIGYGTDQVNWHRGHPLGRLPCNTEFRQRMLINKGSAYQEYRTNTIRAGIEADGKLWVERDGVRNVSPSPY